VVTPQYHERVVGMASSVTRSGLEPGTTYRIRVWSTNGASVSSGLAERNVATTESGEVSVECECSNPLKIIEQHTVYSSSSYSWVNLDRNI